ncbi:uncharacterized protein C7orf31 homolog [Archocentrus centrarchus]|uniref:uncharacterized protein C7orf31 homolog n=1 Tax=Archocentrus centrarchus TaxID=63155 RepID=UPI0011EA0CA6|nr:uncharacterized protein C7orf31 homolog [Archocentrus centrarchus]
MDPLMGQMNLSGPGSGLYLLYSHSLIMSQVFSSHMESSLTNGFRADLNRHYPCSYGGTIPASISNQHCYNSVGRKKSNVQLNDQVMPKPTDINIAEKMIKAAIPKEHPYSSHISHFAMFPSFRSPDDPDTGVRAASQSFLNLSIPNSAPDITLLRKTKGGPYRHEILETPLKTRKKALMWTGEHGFFDHAKPAKGESQVFYPTPPKMVLPNPKLRDWDLTLSERTSNILKNLEKSLWVTSYQMHYTGLGPANPLRTDDFKEKMTNFTGIHSHTSLLQERSHPVFIPSKPRQGYRKRLGSNVRRSSCSPTAAELQNTSPALNQSTASSAINQPQEITATRNEAPVLNQMGHTQSECSTNSTKAEHTEQSQEVLRKQQTQCKYSVHKGRKRENHKVQFDDSVMRGSSSQSSQEPHAAQITNTERPWDPSNCPHSQGEIEANGEKSLSVKDVPSSKQLFKVGRNIPSCSSWLFEDKDQTSNESHTKWLPGAEGREQPRGTSNPCITPRPPIPSGSGPVDRLWTGVKEGAALTFLDLQNSFSKSEAHRNFNNSITHATVNLQDNIVSGRKHDFFGINCHYIHG